MRHSLRRCLQQRKRGVDLFDTDADQKPGIATVALRSENEETGLGILQCVSTGRTLRQTVTGRLAQQRSSELDRSLRRIALVNLQFLVQRPIRPIANLTMIRFDKQFFTLSTASERSVQRLMRTASRSSDVCRISSILAALIH